MFRARTRASDLHASRTLDGAQLSASDTESGISRLSRRRQGAVGLFKKLQGPWWCLVIASLGAGRLVSARGTASAHPEVSANAADVARVGSTSGRIANLAETARDGEASGDRAAVPDVDAILNETKLFEVAPQDSRAPNETEALAADGVGTASETLPVRSASRARGRWGTSTRPIAAAHPSGGVSAPALPGSAGPTSLVEGGRPELRVLLIGNSYTMHHTLHTLLQRLAASVVEGPQIIVDAEAHGGYSLRSHLRARAALAKIRSGHYTHVVLQGHSLSALDHRAEFEADAERFKQAIDAAAGHTVFYATWARSPEARIYLRHPAVHSFEEMTQLVSSTYSDLSQRLGAELAPVGRAFERSLVRYPKLALWGVDGSHPTLAGSYLAACVLYAAISGTDPRGAEYVPPGMASAEAEQIREVAAEGFTRLKVVPTRATDLATAPL